MLHFFHNLKKYILDTLFPLFCLGCKKEGVLICNGCLDKIKIDKYAICPVCHKRLINRKKCAFCKNKTALNGLLAANTQNDPLLHQIIYAYKYDLMETLASPLSKILIRYLQNISIHHDFEPLLKTNQIIFIPVPLHKKRLKWRGFNQSEVLAKNIVKEFNQNIENAQSYLLIDVLRRFKDTIPQKEIDNKAERQKNIQNAFRASELALKYNPIKNKIVILVDDICTTGSTLEECAKTLKPLKPKEIWALVLTRG